MRTVRRQTVRTVIAVILAMVPVGVAAQVCRPGIPMARQHRPAMRRRTPSLDPPVRTTVVQVSSWPPPVDAENPTVHDRDDPIDERETQAYSLQGALRRVALESDDCDLHLELSAPGAPASAPRIVAEVPAAPMFQSVRDTILRALPASVHLAPGRPVDLPVPIPMTVTGFAFYDTARGGRGDPRQPSHESPQVATLWGFHPTWSVTVNGH